MSVNQCTHSIKKSNLLHSVSCHKFAILYLVITFDGHFGFSMKEKTGIPLFAYLCKNISGINSQSGISRLPPKRLRSKQNM